MLFFRHKFLSLQLALLILGWVSVSGTLAQESINEGEISSNVYGSTKEYGPTNMLKTLHNPFMGVQGGENIDSTTTSSIDSPISIDATNNESLAIRTAHGLTQKFAAPLLYLPGRLVMGRPAEFVVKGKAGYYTALAMADRDSGAKPVYGHVIHLGPDRKVVSVGRIPQSGLLHLWIEAPFEGDLVGLPLYFEAAVWSEDGFSDLQMATPVRSELEEAQATGNFENGVIMSASADMLKKDPFVVHETTETTMQHMQYAGPHLDSGRP